MYVLQIKLFIPPIDIQNILLTRCSLYDAQMHAQWWRFAFARCKAVRANVLPLPTAIQYYQGLGLASMSGRRQTQTLVNINII